jgi:hypothetical protein
VSSEGGRRLTLWHWVLIALVVLAAIVYVATQGLTFG